MTYIEVVVKLRTILIGRRDGDHLSRWRSIVIRTQILKYY
jgi:hypothetical protein